MAGSEEAVASSTAEGAVVAVGSGQPVKAFQVALKTMKEGEKTKLKIKPECELRGGKPCTPMHDVHSVDVYIQCALNYRSAITARQ